MPSQSAHSCIPAKAVALNFAAVAAANGVLVFVWQEGHGSNNLWQITATGAITFWAPVFVFAFLFGLSMDYEVFILSRIQEEYQATGSTPGAVVAGLGHTGRLVTSAARCNWWLPARRARPHRRLPARIPAPQEPAGKTPGT